MGMFSFSLQLVIAIMRRCFLFILDALILRKAKEDENVKIANVTSATMGSALPPEMINEILTWLPVKSLLRFKCVCKQWHSLIESQDFVSEYWLRSSPTIGISPLADKDGMKSLGICRGLILEKNAETKEMRIRNPATRQVLDLPDPGWDGISYEFLGYIECTRTFKVVSFRSEVNKYIGWRVLTIGSADTLSWEKCKPPSELKILAAPKGPMIFSLDTSIMNFPGKVFSNGVLLEEIQIISFDLMSNQVRKHCVPRDFWANIDRDNLEPVKWDSDRIASAYIAEEKLHVTVLEDFRTETWSTEKMVIPLDFLKNQQYAAMMSSDSIYFVGRKGDSLRFQLSTKKSLLYNLKTKEVVELERKTAQVELCPSLVKLEGMHPQLERLKGEQELQVQSLVDNAAEGEQ